MNEKKLKTGPECSRTFSDKKKNFSTKQKAHCKKFVMFFFLFFFFIMKQSDELVVYTKIKV